MTAVPLEAGIALSIVVMSHPKRAAQAARIAQAMAPATVVTDPDLTGTPSPLRTAVHAWRAHAPEATHHLVLQDDVDADREELLSAVRRGIALFPDAVLGFFAHLDSLNGAMLRLAAAAGAHWTEAVSSEYFPCQAVVLPVRHIAALCEFVEPVRAFRREDDEVLSDFLSMYRIPGILSVPSLVDHIDSGSLTGNAHQDGALRGTFAPRGHGEILAGMVDLLPFFSKGVGHCMAQGADGAWRRLHWIEAMAGLGIDPRTVDDELTAHLAVRTATGDRPTLPTGFLTSLWATAYLIGFLAASGRVPLKPLGESPGAVRADLLAAAWRSLAHAGLKGTSLDRDLLVGAEPFVMELTDAAHAAGRAAGHRQHLMEGALA
ncbi:hypothetical protein [Catellatospora sp. NPDC049609]|uniref:hypothetical protein n=1 Tax=Catellatospora sp. NPDC049609 TaxID=3155505 RepID=UPI0034395FFC